jgi:hypothetical protein
MPVVQEWWKKLNANEKLVMYGAAIVVLGFLLSLGSFGGYGSFDLIAAIAIAVIYWLKYSPNKITWPAPVQTIVFGIAGFAAVVAVLALFVALSFIFAFGLYGISVLVNAIGAGLMAYGAWKEYQAMPKTTPPATPPAPPAPPAA